MIDVSVLVGSQVREATTGRTGRVSSVSLPWVKVAWNQDPLYRAVEEAYSRSDPKIWTDFELFTLNGGWVSMGSILGSRPRGRIKQFTEDMEQLLSDAVPLEERVEIPNAKEQKEAWKLLKQALKAKKLPTKAGKLRGADIDEFMLMYKKGPYYAFKHRMTRNHVFVEHPSGKLVVPMKSEPFMRGEFDLGTESVETQVMYRKGEGLPFRSRTFESKERASAFVSDLLEAEYAEIRWLADGMEEDWEIELSGLFQLLSEDCRSCDEKMLESMSGTSLFNRKANGPESRPEEWECDDDGCVHEPSGFTIKIDFGE